MLILYNEKLVSLTYVINGANANNGLLIMLQIAYCLCSNGKYKHWYILISFFHEKSKK